MMEGIFGGISRSEPPNCEAPRQPTIYPDWFEGFVNWVPRPKLGPAVDCDGVTDDVIQKILHLLPQAGFDPPIDG